MTSKINAARNTLIGSSLRFGASFRRDGAAQKFSADSAPLRSELFSADQMEQHGKALAGSHELSRERASNQLLARLADNQDLLIEACGLLTAAVRAERRITPAGEWLLDNFHLVTSEIRNIHQHLPGTCYRQLPTLASREQAGHPRIYAMAVELVRHSDSRIDRQQLAVFVNS